MQTILSEEDSIWAAHPYSGGTDVSYVSGCSAVINRYGFNSKGVDAVRANLLSYRRGLLQRPVNKPGGLPGLVGVNLGRQSLHCSTLSKPGPCWSFIL